jgi:hypothetical protein
MTMTRILIGALSGWKHHERRGRCLATWMADGDAMGVRSVFLLGCPTAEAAEEIGCHHLVLPCPDDYASLPQRTRLFCQWALSTEYSALSTHWDYLFKCDDDTYVSIPRLLAYDLAGRDYVGAEWRPGAAYGSGGAGYFLSRKAAATVADRLTMPSGAEDLLVGQVLRAAGIPLSIEPRFVPFGSAARRPARSNDLITCHAGPAAWQFSHAETGLPITA